MHKSRPALVKAAGKADGLAEGPETVILTLPDSDPNFVPGASATATITINP